MRLLIGLLLFWISIIGYSNLLKRKAELPNEFYLPFLFTIIGIIMFLSGLLNIMSIITLLILIGGIVLLLYYLLKKEFDFKIINNTNSIIIILVMAYLTIICSQCHLIHYDNFSHWGLIVKNMFMRNGFPNFENTTIMFQNYQPGSASFIFYIGYILGKTESSMIIAQNYLIASYYFSLLYFTNKKFNVNKIIVIVLYLFIMFGNILYYDLLVDTLLSVMVIFSFELLIYFKDNLKKAFYYSLPISVFIFLVKNVGIILICYNALGLIYLGFKNKNIKKGFIYAFLTGLISLIFFYLWSKHVSYVFGSVALDSKHALSISHILSELSNKGIDKIFEFCQIYLRYFFNIKLNIAQKYIIGINIILILLLIMYKNDYKKVLKELFLCDFIYLSYYLILGVMYLLSMPWEEAIVLASFDRYMLTIVYVLIGIVLILFLNLVKENNYNAKSIIISFIFIILCIFVNVKYNNLNFNKIVGNQDYDNTILSKFDEALSTDMYYANNELYYIYAPEYIKNYEGYLYFMSIYKLNSKNFKLISNIEEIEKNNYYLIVLEKNEIIKNYILENNYIKKSEFLYLDN